MPGRLWLVVGLLAVSPPLRADDRPVYPFAPAPQPRAATGAMPHLPLEAIDPQVRDRVRGVLEHPALSSRAQPEAFNSEMPVYRWLLDHPDLTVKLWKLVGANVQDIHDRGDGVYVWRDEHGSEVSWHSVLKQDGLHAWYAEGKVKASALLPMTSFRALAVLSFREGQDAAGKPAIQHQVHFLLRCDSKAVALAMKILGASAPRMAEQYLGQLQMFYGGMAWYLGQDEERARKMYRQIGLAVPDR